MSTLALEDCEEGMVVVLTHPSPDYDIGPFNPLVGTEYECTGRITEIDIEEGDIYVDWQNGAGNAYVSNELSLYEDCDKVESIWNF